MRLLILTAVAIQWIKVKTLHIYQNYLNFTPHLFVLANCIPLCSSPLLSYGKEWKLSPPSFEILSPSPGNKIASISFLPKSYERHKLQQNIAKINKYNLFSCVILHWNAKFIGYIAMYRQRKIMSYNNIHTCLRPYRSLWVYHRILVWCSR